MDRWYREGSQKVRPLREQHGFTILGPWVIEERNHFVWILEYAGPDGWEAADGRYYESEERRSLRPEPTRHLERSEHWMLVEPGRWPARSSLPFPSCPFGVVARRRGNRVS